MQTIMAQAMRFVAGILVCSVEKKLLTMNPKSQATEHGI
jgi:hypothetical protein